MFVVVKGCFEYTIHFLSLSLCLCLSLSRFVSYITHPLLSERLCHGSIHALSFTLLLSVQYIYFMVSNLDKS